MRISDIIEAAGVGRVVPGVNMPKGMHTDEITWQAAKFGNLVDQDGRPPIARTDGRDALREKEDSVDETWSKKYKKSIDCSRPKGFSQKAHCAGRKKRQAGGKTNSKRVDESDLDNAIVGMLGLLESKGLGEVQSLERIDACLSEDLRKWFRQKWVRFGPDGKIRGACARGSTGEGKPKCLPQSKAHSLGKEGRAKAARRKRRKDPNPDRTGKARNVATKESMSCPHCGGEMVAEELVSEKKDACYYKVKSRYKVWPSAYASGALVQCRKKGASNWGKKK